VTKTDNKDPAAKLELRRHFLRTYHEDKPPRVFDCCQATGFLWQTLRSEFPVANYWGVDVKEKKGRLKIDSVRVLEQPGLNADVVDVDTYGSPWKHWAALLPNIKQPTTVFLTIGQVSMGTDCLIPAALGLGDLPVPPGIALKLHDMALAHLLGAADRHGLKIVECKEAIGGPANARYIGVHLRPG
jgi:hypothetical protein